VLHVILVLYGTARSRFPVRILHFAYSPYSASRLRVWAEDQIGTFLRNVQDGSESRPYPGAPGPPERQSL
jgi:hypothetical protein